MLSQLIASAHRFSDLPAHGYEEADVRWIIEVSPQGKHSLVGPLGKRELVKRIPVRGDRSGKASDGNAKAALLVDRASYALGMRPNRDLEPQCPEHKAFRKLIEDMDVAASGLGVVRVLRFLDDLFDKGNPLARALAREISDKVKPNEIVAFRIDADGFPFESQEAQAFWRDFLVSEYRLPQNGQCCCCGQAGPVLRILPFQVSFAGYSCPIASFNEEAFDSFGKSQTGNSPLCFACASQSSRLLQFLLTSERHRRILVRDESRGGGKTPLRNQWAAFWLSDSDGRTEDQGHFDLEQAFAKPFGASGAGMPSLPEQVKKLYGLPYAESSKALQIDGKRFFIAVLSPNKSRLVLRDWIEEAADRVVERLLAYDTARTLVTADGCGETRPDVPAMLESLRPVKSTSHATDANLVRALLATAYQGAPPPMKLLESAVLRIRVPDRAKSKQEEEEARERRQTLVACIKFVLTYGKKEAQTLQSLDESIKTTPYLCGQLLAVLEEAQMRSSKWGVKATLVDRFYGAASTSPRTALSGLVRQATIAHMPKIRKVGGGYQDLERVLESVMVRIDDAGGFPAALTLRQQGEFALGFYHQRACFSAARASRAVNREEKNEKPL